jgi:type II secretory pathway component PulC
MNMLRSGLTVVQTLLGIACLYLMVSCAGALVPSSPDFEELALAPPPEAPPVAARDPERYRIIGERNLFHAAGLDTVVALAPAKETLLETRLPLKLRGTVVSPLREHSLAVIEHGAQAETIVVREGDWVGEARIEHVERKRVVLRNRGQRELIMFEEKSATGGSDGRATARATRRTRAAKELAARVNSQRPPAPTARRRTPRIDVSEAIGNTAVPASPDPNLEYSDLGNEERLKSLSEQARFAPSLGEEGGLRGVLVTDIAAGSQLESIGLRNGDIVVSIGGIPLQDPAQVIPTLQGLDLSAGTTLLVERGGAATTISVPPGSI